MSDENFQVLTFGCRLNIYESEVIKDHLRKQNLQDITVLNTCTVTNEAQKEAIKVIKKIKRENPKSRIIVTGCGAQVSHQVFSNMPEVERVIGNQEKLLPESYLLDQEECRLCKIKSICD